MFQVRVMTSGLIDQRGPSMFEVLRVRFGVPESTVPESGRLSLVQWVPKVVVQVSVGCDLP